MKLGTRIDPRSLIPHSYWLAGLVLAGLLLVPTASVWAASSGKYVVNATTDGGDASPGDNVCDDGAGSCTLRAAIDESNAHVGKDTITFKITSSTAPWVISPASELPQITDAVTLDAVTGTGASCKTMFLTVRIDGSATTSVSGLTLSGAASGSTVKGLSITGFAQDGLLLLQVSSVMIQCNIIGLQEDGLTPAGNNHGIEINGMGGIADLNTIGGATTTRNVISGNLNNGIYIHNIVAPAAKGNKILSNYIGTDLTGTVGLGNAVGIDIDTAPKTVIGGKTTLGNVIAANIGDGIALNVAPSTIIQSNKIGTDTTGTLDLGNVSVGINATDSPDLLIGGSNKSYANTISGNGASGIVLTGAAGSNNVLIQGNYIGVTSGGSVQLPNGGSGVLLSGSSSNVTIGGLKSDLRNIISGNTLAGVNILTPSTGNKIQGNYIGVDKGGYFSVPNGASGVNINSASGNTIGGTTAALRNVISGNGTYGISINSSVSGNTIQGNYIGVNAAAGAALPNGQGGISLSACTGCLIGGLTTAGERNIISGNTGPGIQISSGGANLVYGNFIGTDVKGKLALPNGSGVASNTSSDNQIGSATTALARNIISGNASDAINIASDDSDTVAGNYIGTDLTGKLLLGNGGYGIALFNATNTVVGGAGVTARNLISGSSFYGMRIAGISGAGNQVLNNYIGTDVTGKVAIGNGQHPTASYGGIYIDSTPGTAIGGSSPDDRNLISGNDGSGIEVFLASGTVIRGNYIGLDVTGAKAMPNTNLGIELSNPTNTVIGGSGTSDGNVISGNLGGGIDVTQGNLNTILGNRIGTDLTGLLAIPNLYSGISTNSAVGLTIGGPGATDGNLISGNTGNGITLSGASPSLVAQGNLIGLDITRTMPLSNGFMGISSAVPATIADNVIAFNGTGGIYQDSAFGPSSTGNCLFYNLVPAGFTYKNNSAVNATFTGNWWGDPAGPLVNTHDYANPARQDVVNTSVGTVVFNPWTTTVPSGCPQAESLLAGNGGMETDTTPADAIPDLWTGSGVVIASGEGRRSDDVHSGGYSFKMTGGGKTAITQTNAAAGAAGDVILLSFYTRGIGVSGKGSYQASVAIGKKATLFNIPVNTAGSTGGWVIHTLAFKAPASFTSVSVTLTYSMPYGSVWFDDVNLSRITVAP